MLYTAYGNECKLSLNLIFGDNYELRAEYKEGDTWTYIAGPDFYGSQLSTKEKTDDFYKTALDEINLAMESLFGGVDEPGNLLTLICKLIDQQGNQVI